MPEICSRSTRLIESMRFCINRKPPIIRLMMSPIAPISTGIATSSSSDSSAFCRTAMMMPPMHMIGAASSMVQVISTSICTCCTSLVLRVISDGAPKLFTSRAEKLPTWWKIAARTSRPKAIAVRAPKYTAPIEQPICSSVTASMMPPVETM